MTHGGVPGTNDHNNQQWSKGKGGGGGASRVALFVSLKVSDGKTWKLAAPKDGEEGINQDGERLKV